VALCLVARNLVLPVAVLLLIPEGGIKVIQEATIRAAGHVEAAGAQHPQRHLQRPKGSHREDGLTKLLESRLQEGGELFARPAQPRDDAVVIAQRAGLCGCDIQDHVIVELSEHEALRVCWPAS
jgi:hypothetical protein